MNEFLSSPLIHIITPFGLNYVIFKNNVWSCARAERDYENKNYYNFAAVGRGSRLVSKCLPLHSTLRNLYKQNSPLYHSQERLLSPNGKVQK